jgi:hypothetical protein
MAIDPITAVLSIGESLITRLFPDPAKQAEERLKLAAMAQEGDLTRLKANVDLMLAQIEVNKTEAAHKSTFVAGWRPAVGWLCVLVMAFNYVGVYILEFASLLFDSKLTLPDRFDMSELYPILFGMLGIGGMRSFDKAKGTQTDSIGSRK